jgi:hypothetical protein
MPAEQVLTGYFDPNNNPGGNFAPLGRARGAVSVNASTTVSAKMAVMISMTSSSGSVSLTLSDGTGIVVNCQLGDNIYPFGVTWWAPISATPSAVYNLY